MEKINPKIKTGKLHYENKEFTNKYGEKFTVLHYNNAKNIDIKFSDGTIINTRAYLINNGKVINPNYKKLFGKCFIGIGNYSSKDYSYSIWFKILQRVFDNKIKENLPTYNNVTLDDRWLNFQNFGKWFEENYINGFDLDKDILIKNNKHYGPDTCCFVPHEINCLFRNIINLKSKNINLPEGVTFCNDRNSKQYLSNILINNKKIYIGHFNTPEEAENEYLKFKCLKIHELANKYKDKLNKKVYDKLISIDIDYFKNKKNI